MPMLDKYCFILGGGIIAFCPVPRMRISGLGVTTSKTLKWSGVQASQSLAAPVTVGTFQSNTLPPRNMQADGKINPSTSSIPSSEIFFTAIAVGTSSGAKMFDSDNDDRTTEVVDALRVRWCWKETDNRESDGRHVSLQQWTVVPWSIRFEYSSGSLLSI